MMTAPDGVRLTGSSQPKASTKMAHTLNLDEMSENDIHEEFYAALCSAEHNRTVIANMIVSRLGMNGAYWFLSRFALHFWLGSLNNQQLVKLRVLLEAWSE